MSRSRALGSPATASTSGPPAGPVHPAVAPLAVAAVALGPLVLPIVPTLARNFLGVEFVDHYGTQWFYWFAERQLTHLESPATTDLFFHPWGKDIYTHTGANLLDAFAAVPFRVLLGPVAGYNVFVLVVVALGAVAVARLVHELTGDRSAAATAAVLATASPFVVQELIEGRPTQAFILLPALLLRALWRLGTRPERAGALSVGVLLALCGYQYWYYALFGGIICVAHGAWRVCFPAEGAGGRGPTFARHVAAAVVASVLVAPVAGPLALSTQLGAAGIPGMLDVSTWSPLLVSTVTAAREEAGLFLWQPLRGTFGFYTLHADGGGWAGERASIGTVLEFALLLVGIPLLARGRRGGVAVMAVTACLLAIGPILVLGPTYVGNPLYLLLAHALGVVRRLWWPGRAYAFVLLLVAVATGSLLAALGRRARWLPLLTGLLFAAVLTTGQALRGAVPLPTWDATIPAGFRCLASGPPGGVIVLPFDADQADVYYQVGHGRPMFGGMRDEYDMFVPEGWRRFRDENSFVQALVELDPSAREASEWSVEDETRFRALGIRYLVLRLERWGLGPDVDDSLVNIGIRNRRQHLVRTLVARFGPPVRADARVEIYDLEGAESPCAGAGVVPDDAPRRPVDVTLATGLGSDTVRKVIVAPTTLW